MRLSRLISLPTVCAVALAALLVPAGAAAAEETETATVLSEGTVRIANSLDGEALRLDLIDADGMIRDIGSTVLAIPTAEDWPGEQYAEGSTERAAWEAAAPERGTVWRTYPVETEGAANPLVLGYDAQNIARTAVGGDRNVNMHLHEVTGPDGAHLGNLSGQGRPYWTGSAEEVSTNTRTIAVNRALRQLASDGQSHFVFDREGVYCITVQSEAQLPAGDIAQVRSTLTFVVGESIAPETVTPCAQPGALSSVSPEPAPDLGANTVVIDSGDARLYSVVDDDGDVDLSVVSVNNWAAYRTSYNPARVVFSVPDRDTVWPGATFEAGDSGFAQWATIADPDTQLWRTPGNRSLTTSPSNDLYLSFDTGTASSRATFDLAPEQITTDSGGYVASYRTAVNDAVTSGSAATWDSRPGGKRDAILVTGNGDFFRPYYAPVAQGLAFSDPGVYCLTLSSTATLADGSTSLDAATFTFAVGVDATTVTPCEQVPVDGADPDGEGTGETLDPTVAYFDRGHLDVGTVLRDGAPTLYTGDAATTGLHDLGDSIWVGRGSATQFRVPNAEEYAFIGEPGSPYWGFTQSPAYQDRTLWPGFSNLNFRGLTRTSTYTLRGVDGPGEVVAYNGERVLFSSRPGAAKSFELGPSHNHMNWAFTAEGVYCLNLEVRLRLDDADTNSVAGGLLTVVIGDTDLSTVQPCERTHEEWPAFAPDDLGSVDAAAWTATGGTVSFTARVDESGLDVTADHSPVLGQPWTSHDVEQTVFATSRTYGGQWHVEQTGGSLELFSDTTQLNPAAFDGDLGLKLGEVSGPGTFTLKRLEGSPLVPVLGTGEEDELRETTLWPGYRSYLTASFSAAGVYCVPLTWSGTRSDGTPVSTTKTLTFAAGSTDSASPDYVDRTGVTPCAEGGEATDPGDEGEEPAPETPSWDVLNWSRTDSGATVLNDGHVDVASVLEDGVLRTRVKDTTTEGVANSSEGSEGGNATWHELDEVVFQLLPGTEQVIPEQERYGFIGEAGAPMWQVSQGEQPGVLWPGWSAESIPAAQIEGGELSWTLTSVDGPGDAFVWQADSFGDPIHIFDSKNGLPDTTSISGGSHVHANWTFTAEGVYCLAFERAATLTSSGAAVSDEFTLAVVVGRADPTVVDPASCVGAMPEPEVAVPGAPVAPGLSADGSTVSVTWIAPADGGAPITGYTVTLTPAEGDPFSQQAAADAASATFTEVPAGTWTATVVATNTVGSSAASPVSESVTVTAPEPAPEPTAPETPAAPDASVSGNTVSVSWIAPADGGSAITGYTVVLTPGTGEPISQNAAANVSSVVFTEVPAGIWTATVVAINARGSSSASADSAAVTVATTGDPDPTDPDPTDPVGPEPTDPVDPDPTDPKPAPGADLTDANRGGLANTGAGESFVFPAAAGAVLLLLLGAVILIGVGKRRREISQG